MVLYRFVGHDNLPDGEFVAVGCNKNFIDNDEAPKKNVMVLLKHPLLH